MSLQHVSLWNYDGVAYFYDLLALVNFAVSRANHQLTGSVPPVKTMVCRYFAAKAWCYNGDKCTFAHGEAELGTSRMGNINVAEALSYGTL